MLSRLVLARFYLYYSCDCWCWCSQVTAIYDAAAIAREYGKTIIADGGINILEILKRWLVEMLLCLDQCLLELMNSGETEIFRT